MSAALSPERLRSQRTNPVVLKTKLATLRSHSPCVLVVVLEGQEDLTVYEIWIKRLADKLKWEPIIAHGKGNVLIFRDLVRRDKTGLGICTYFIVDHDYDGLRFATDDNDIYVLPAYSIENYLTDAEVFDSFLRTDLQVVGDPEVRTVLLERFKHLERLFIDAIMPACVSLYGARNESVGNVVINERVQDFIEIDINNVQVRPGTNIDHMIRSDSPISHEGRVQGRAFFGTCNPHFWIRGKFVLHFYKSICELFYEDRRSLAPTLFSERVQVRSYAPISVDFRSLAPKSALPEGLKEKIEKWVSACAERCAS
ncbi:MAG: DUF4435 domain-containing protein [Metallibacterium scheffleri]